MNFFECLKFKLIFKNQEKVKSEKQYYVNV